MTELKTKSTQADVAKFIAGIADEQRRADCQIVLDLMRSATGEEPVLRDSSIVGFGTHHYRHASGRGGDWFLAGFSPRKQDLYIVPGLDAYPDFLERLGRFKTGRSCLYLKRLGDIDREVLMELLRRSVADLRKAAASAEAER